MYLGLDFGTSGARACVLDESETLVYQDHISYRDVYNQTAEDWRDALHKLLKQLPLSIAEQIQRISLDATSGTVMLCDAQLQPISPPLLYNDTRAQAQALQLNTITPAGHTVCSASSGLAKFLWLTQQKNVEQENTADLF